MRLTRRGLQAAGYLSYPGSFYPGATTVVTDSFTRSDSTSTLGSADTGQAYTAHSGIWGISSNKGYCVTTGSTDCVATLDAGVSDFGVSVDITYNNAYPSLVFRGVNATNYLMVLMYGDSAGGGPYLNLFKRVSGSYTSLATWPSAFSSGTTYQIAIRCSGSSIIGYVNGAQVGTKTDSTHSSGTRVGFRVQSPSNPINVPRWDNLSVTTP